MNIKRRRFLQGTAALFCAPAIVKADNLMKIWVPPNPKGWLHTGEGIYKLDMSAGGFDAGDSIVLEPATGIEDQVWSAAGGNTLSQFVIYYDLDGNFNA